jgi:dTDP-4-amino-4,6-dideoxygalactose transaminase
VDKYSWVDVGSSYLMNDLSAAYLWGNIEKVDEINQNRLNTWHQYYDNLKDLKVQRLIDLPIVPNNCTHNAHMFYIKVRSLNVRGELIDHLKENGILATFHYVPLHSSEAGIKFGKFYGNDQFTTKESERLIRLPLYFGMSDESVQKVVAAIRGYFTNE